MQQFDSAYQVIISMLDLDFLLKLGLQRIKSYKKKKEEN